MNNIEARNAKVAILLRRASSLLLRGFAELDFLKSPFVFVSDIVSASDSEAAVDAAVEALVDDLSLEAIFNQFVEAPGFTILSDTVVLALS